MNRMFNLLTKSPRFIKNYLVNAKDRLGNTPLHKAKTIPKTKWLLENGADPNAKNNDGETPLHKVRITGQIPLLIEKGANVNAINNQGYRPLCYAEKLEIAREFIRAGAETIRVQNINSDIQALITQHATQLREKLQILARLPENINELSYEQKYLLITLTAPENAGNPLTIREDLKRKSLIRYLRENKSQLLQFALEYQGSKIFGGIREQTADGLNVPIFNPKTASLEQLVIEKMVTLSDPKNNELSPHVKEKLRRDWTGFQKNIESPVSAFKEERKEKSVVKIQASFREHKVRSRGERIRKAPFRQEQLEI